MAAISPGGASAVAGVDHIGGFRTESYFSLTRRLDRYKGRIPRELLWIMDDPCGNAICVGIIGSYRGRVYFWDHEQEEDEPSLRNISEIAETFAGFVNALSE